jgi:crotonobetainyl-CoA:carnitine CoA-transferase CaiB-like acyl-CoA transferase
MAVVALGGVMGLMGDPEDKLMRAGNESYRTGMGDLPTALALTSAILSGLHLREKSGRGCEVETSLLRNAGFVIGCDMSVAMVDNKQPAPMSREAFGSPLVRAYLCQDGRKIFYCQPISWEKYWGRFTTMIGKNEEWGGFKNVFPALNEEVHTEIEAIMATKTLAEWTDLSAQAELTFAPVATLPEYIASEQAQAAGAIATVPHPLYSEGVKVPNTPFGMPGEDVVPRGPAPEPGEHTAEVLAAAGYSEEELATFEAAGVTGHRPFPGSPLEKWGSVMRAATDGGGD